MPARTSYIAQHVLTIVGATGGEMISSALPTMEPPGAGATFSMATPTTMSITETINLPLTSPPTPPVAPLDGQETLAGPIISLTDISMPTSYLGDTLSGLGSAPSNTSGGTFDIFPNVKLTVTEGTPTITSPGQATATTTATVAGPIAELNSWVVPWTPTDSIPKFNGSDYAKVKSEGYGRDNGAFIISFKLLFTLKSPLAAHPAKQEVEFQIKVLNNFDNDRDQYISDYNDAYQALDKVPELSERDS